MSTEDMEKFHQRCPTSSMIMPNQLRWTGHCVRTSDKRLPRQVLFAQLTRGTRRRCGQRKRFKDTAKHYLKKGQIDISTWELMAADRPLCRHSIYQATAKFETHRLLHQAEKRLRRKEREKSQYLHLSLPPGTSCSHCQKICRSRIGLLSYLRTHDRPLENVILVSRDR